MDDSQNSKVWERYNNNIIRIQQWDIDPYMVSIVTCMPRRMLFLEPFLYNIIATSFQVYSLGVATWPSVQYIAVPMDSIEYIHASSIGLTIKLSIIIILLCVNHKLLVSTLFELIVSYPWLCTAQVAACRPGRHMCQG